MLYWHDGANFAQWVDGQAPAVHVAEFKFIGDLVRGVGKAVGKVLKPIGKVLKGSVNFARNLLNSAAGRVALGGLCSLITANPALCGTAIAVARRALGSGSSPAEAAAASAATPGGTPVALAQMLMARGGAGDPLALPSTVQLAPSGYLLWHWPGTKAYATSYAGASQIGRTQAGNLFSTQLANGSLYVSFGGSPWRTIGTITNAVQRG